MSAGVRGPFDESPRKFRYFAVFKYHYSKLQFIAFLGNESDVAEVQRVFLLTFSHLRIQVAIYKRNISNNNLFRVMSIVLCPNLLQLCLVKGNQAYVPDTTVHNDDVWVRWLTKISNDCSIFFRLPFHQADLPLSVHFQQMISRNTPENYNRIILKQTTQTGLIKLIAGHTTQLRQQSVNRAECRIV